MAKVVTFIRQQADVSVAVETSLPSPEPTVNRVDDVTIAERMQAKIKAGLEARHHRELEQKFREGYQQGVDDSVRKQKDQALTELNEQIQKVRQVSRLLAQVTDELQREKQSLVAQTKAELVEVIFDAVGQLICREFIRDKRRVELLLSSLLEAHQSGDNIKIQLSESDLMLLHSHEPFMDSHPNVQFSASKGVEPGGVILTSRKGQLDLRLSTKLEQFMRLLQRHGEVD